MDQLSEEVRQESPWTMMFADDIVICSESREQVEENLERWRFALERRGMKVSGSKTEYMCVNEREGRGTVRLQGEEVKKVQEFKYLGSTVQSNGECGKEVKKRVQAGWNGWRQVWGVLCERKISARIKGKVYRTVVRAAMLYGLETVSLRKRQESELEVAELKMLRFSLGVTRLDRIRNEYIRGTAHVGHMGDKVREDRLRWFGHVQRRESLMSIPTAASGQTGGGDMQSPGAISPSFLPPPSGKVPGRKRGRPPLKRHPEYQSRYPESLPPIKVPKKRGRKPGFKLKSRLAMTPLAISPPSSTPEPDMSSIPQDAATVPHSATPEVLTEEFDKRRKEDLLLTADFFNILVPRPASKQVDKATLYEALVEQQILPEREVLPGVATQPPQASAAAGANTEPGSWLGDEAYFERLRVGSVDSGMQLALKELES
ncbi:hypothetical protein QTP70_011016 [Hemibagrus guttatus]|uniref:ribonuclease H n=1 Tax=Hemibagrus guttatus TaxID=175788 RepID=A0AAE0PR09_9TELE|nr:hypothetical protein QTP70_011016 [Hemibagrus guttatus]